MKTKAERWKEKDGQLTEEKVCGALNALFFMEGLRLPCGDGFIPGRNNMTKEERRAADRKRYEDDHKWGIIYAKRAIMQGKWLDLFQNSSFYHIEAITFINVRQVGSKRYLGFHVKFENGYEMTLLVNPTKAHVSKNLFRPDNDDRCIMQLQSA